MSKAARFEPHLTPAAIRERYRRCAVPVEKPRWLFILHVSEGATAKGAAHAAGFAQSTGTKLLRRWNEAGPDGLADGRAGRAGRPPLLDAAVRVELAERLDTPPPDGGLWTGPKVAKWMARRLGRAAVSPQRGWEALVTLGMNAVGPRRRHVKADPEAAETFKKKRCPTPSPPFARPIRAPRSRSGPPMSTASVSSPSSAGSGSGAARDRWPASTPATNGCGSTGSCDPAATRPPSFSCPRSTAR